MTPWQFRVAVEAYSKKRGLEHDQAAWIMWHGAAISRSKKMPELKEFLSSAKKPVKIIDERGIKERLKAYSKRLKDGN